MHLIENIQRYPMFLVGTLIFLTLGIAVTVWARRIRQFAIQFYERHPVIARFTLFRRHIYSEFYLFELRACGVLSLFVGVFCFWALCIGQ